jgi:hypothetical protein
MKLIQHMSSLLWLGVLTSVQQRHLARLLVRYRKHILQAPITVTKFIPAALLRLDALLANFLATTLDNPAAQAK